MRYITIKIFIIIIFYLIPCVGISQNLRPMKLRIPSEKENIKSVIHSVVQSMRQHKEGLIIQHFLDKTKDVKTNVKSFFNVTSKRKENKKWLELSPKSSLSANWDFQISDPEIIIDDELQATVKLQFYWLTDVPLVKNTEVSELKNPNKRINDIWYLQKTG